VVAALVQPEYVYLLRVVEAAPPTHPRAKIPTVAVPTADPHLDAALAAVADALTQPENVYLLRIVERTPQANPKAKIAKVADTFPCVGHMPSF
jgi:hypothetical protein